MIDDTEVRNAVTHFGSWHDDENDDPSEVEENPFAPAEAFAQPERSEFSIVAEKPFSLPIREFIALERPNVEPLLTDMDGRTIVSRHSLTLLGALGGAGKTTWFIELALHLAAGVDYLCFLVPRAVSILMIENEGPESMFAEKLAAKLATFPHELKARVDVVTLDWGGFSLADDEHRAKLRAEITAHGYDLVFGDPLDSLGIDGVGSPEDTRNFLLLMKETGLNKTVAWWLNTHPRKEETREALNEIAGAWGGKPDTVLLLKMLADDRTQIRFPKLRWAKRGKRPAILLGFDADTEGFTYLGEEDEAERDYLTEIGDLFMDQEWRTAKEIAAPKDGGGIGANERVVKKTLEEHPEKFESRPGNEVGRSPRATCWNCVGGLTQSTQLPLRGGEGAATASLRSPYRNAVDEAVVPPSPSTESGDADSVDSVDAGEA